MYSSAWHTTNGPWVFDEMNNKKKFPSVFYRNNMPWETLFQDNMPLNFLIT